MKRVLVTGGTGVLGRQVVRELHKRGAAPYVLSRKPQSSGVTETVRGDLLDVRGLGAILEGAEVVVHCATDPAKPRRDVQGMKNLLETAKATGIKHLVLISIVGVDQMRWQPYYRAKLEQERLVAGSGVPYTLLRAAQFHEFILQNLTNQGRGPVQLLPGGLIVQPIASDVVAVRLADAALSSPAGRLPDLVGPEPRSLESLGREWVVATGVHKPVIVVPVPGFIRKGFRPVDSPNVERRGRSWTAWLASHISKQNVYQGAEVTR